MTKITGLTALTAQQPDNWLPVVDVHDTTMAATGTTKKITTASLGILAWYNVKSAAYGAKGDGATDDTAAIQAALTAAGASAIGGIVYFPTGTYLVSSDLIVPSSTTLIGDGFDSCLRRKPGPNYCNIITLTSVSNVRITQLQLDGFKNELISSSNGTSYATAISFAYYKLAGVYITGTAVSPCTGVVIDHCWIHDSFYGNIQPDAVNGLILDSNYLYLGRDNQVNCRVQVHNAGGGTCTNMTIVNNVVTGTGYPFPSTGDQFSGIQCIRATNVTIVNNTCTGLGNTFTTEGDGIGLEGSRFVTITGNTCTGNLSQGIKIDGTVEGTPDVWQQYIRYVPGDCVSNAALTGVWKAAAYSLNAALPSVGADNASWTHMASGPYWQNSVDVTVTGNASTGNNFYAATSLQGDGIKILNAEDVVISDNVFSGNTVGFEQSNSVLSMTVHGNSVKGSTSAGMTFYSDVATNSNNGVAGYGPFILRGNYVARNAGKGIDVVVPLVIENNVVHANGAAGVSLGITGTQISGSHPAQVVRGNTFIDNGDDGVLVNGGYAYACAVEIRDNYAPPSAVQPRLVGENGTACRCVNNRVTSQASELWYFTSASSVWIDDTHAQMAASQALPYTVTGLEGGIVPVTGTGTLTLPHPGDGLHSPVGTGYFVTIANTGAGTCTVQPASGNVAGAASVTIATHVSARFFFDGTAWWYA